MLSLVKFYLFIFCPDYIENMVTFTVLAKFYSTKYTKEARLGEIFVWQKFLALAIWY